MVCAAVVTREIANKMMKERASLATPAKKDDCGKIGRSLGMMEVSSGAGSLIPSSWGEIGLEQREDMMVGCCGYKVWVAGAAGLDLGLDFEGPWKDFLAAPITPWKA